MRRISSSPQVVPSSSSSDPHHNGGTTCRNTDNNNNDNIIPKVQSESNLEGLHSSTSMAGGRSGKSRLHTEPSFGIYSADDLDAIFNRSPSFGEHRRLDRQPSFGIYSADDLDFFERSPSFGEQRRLETQFSFGAMRMIHEEHADCEIDDNNNDHIVTAADSDECYAALVRQNPSNSLLLKNYAHFLQTKGDLNGAEEYYLRATVADPKDGEILFQYAKLVWELHHDYRRAVSYFERAVQAAPEDSHIQAAYASFLWEAGEDDEEEENSVNDQADDQTLFVEEVERPASPPLHLAMGLGLGTTDYANDTVDVRESPNPEEYYRKMVDENPCNPLFLGNYAHFLHKSKGDHHLAEDYYSRAILLDPCNGQLLSLFANLVWEIRRDKDRAESYFLRAVQSSPEDSNVLGSYAKFLWETDDDRDDVTKEAQNQMHLHSAGRT